MEKKNSITPGLENNKQNIFPSFSYMEYSDLCEDCYVTNSK